MLELLFESIASFLGGYFTQKAADKNISLKRLFWSIFIILGMFSGGLLFYYGFSINLFIFDFALVFAVSLLICIMVKIHLKRSQKRKSE